MLFVIVYILTSLQNLSEITLNIFFCKFLRRTFKQLMRFVKFNKFFILYILIAVHDTYIVLPEC